MTGFLAESLATFALCWRVERRDGLAIGCTNHDRDLIMNGFRYRSAPGITPSAIEQSDGLKDGVLEIAGALATDTIDETDLIAGRWDGAAVTLFAVDWSDPTQHLRLMRGELGQVTIERNAFKAELKGPGAALDVAVTEETSPMCRAELGDRRCRVDMAGRRTAARIVSFSDLSLELDISDVALNAWAGGRVRWIDGQNAGLIRPVRSSAGNILVLVEPPSFAIHTGDRVQIEEGCDKRFATCRDRFSNMLNFRGEPHLPGVDLLTRYPGE